METKQCSPRQGFIVRILSKIGLRKKKKRKNGKIPSPCSNQARIESPMTTESNISETISLMTGDHGDLPRVSKDDLIDAAIKDPSKVKWNPTIHQVAIKKRDGTLGLKFKIKKQNCNPSNVYVLLKGVKPGSPAFGKLCRGDLLLSLNGTDLFVSNFSDEKAKEIENFLTKEFSTKTEFTFCLQRPLDPSAHTCSVSNNTEPSLCNSEPETLSSLGGSSSGSMNGQATDEEDDTPIIHHAQVENDTQSADISEPGLLVYSQTPPKSTNFEQNELVCVQNKPFVKFIEIMTSSAGQISRLLENGTMPMDADAIHRLFTELNIAHSLESRQYLRISRDNIQLSCKEQFESLLFSQPIDGRIDNMYECHMIHGESADMGRDTVIELEQEQYQYDDIREQWPLLYFTKNSAYFIYFDLMNFLNDKSQEEIEQLVTIINMIKTKSVKSPIFLINTKQMKFDDIVRASRFLEKELKNHLHQNIFNSLELNDETSNRFFLSFDRRDSKLFLERLIHYLRKREFIDLPALTRMALEQNRTVENDLDNMLYLEQMMANQPDRNVETEDIMNKLHEWGKVILGGSVIFSPSFIQRSYKTVKTMLKMSSSCSFTAKEFYDWLKTYDNDTIEQLLIFYQFNSIIYQQDDCFKLVSDMEQVSSLSPANHHSHPTKVIINMNKFLPVSLLVPILKYVAIKVDEHTEITSLTSGNFQHEKNHFYMDLSPSKGLIEISTKNDDEAGKVQSFMQTVMKDFCSYHKDSLSYKLTFKEE